MQYYELPEEVLEDPDQLAAWMAKAIAVAARAKPAARVGSKGKVPAAPARARRGRP
jgi:TfoX/Sxy family transcriptional regulator of competence genes